MYLPLLLSGGALPYRSCSLRLMTEWGGSFILTAVEHGRAFRESDFFLMAFLAPYLCRLLSPDDRVPEPMGLRPVLQRLLDDRAADQYEISQQLTRLGWSTENRYQCLVVVPGSSRTAGMLQRMSVYLESTIPLCGCLLRRETLVCYFNMDRLGMSPDDFYQRMKYYFRENYLKAGYSRVLTGHANLYRQYIQASRTLELGQRESPFLWIYRFDDLALEFLAERAVGGMSMETVCHPGVLRIRKYDADHGTEYLRTLRVFLDNDQSSVCSARELFIHRTTLLYRMERIRGFLESPLTDPNERLYISLSLRLLEQDAIGEGTH